MSDSEPGFGNSPSSSPQSHPEQETEEHVEGEGYRVVLFNDDVHVMDEVIWQLMKALGCPRLIATEIMLKAHHYGQATVIITSREEAERVAGILREISLMVKVEQV